MNTYRLTLEGDELVVRIKDESGCIESGLQRSGEDDDTEYNMFLDAMESIVLAHACAGINVAEKRYVTGIRAALEAAANNL